MRAVRDSPLRLKSAINPTLVYQILLQSTAVSGRNCLNIFFVTIYGNGLFVVIYASVFKSPETTRS